MATNAVTHLRRDQPRIVPENARDAATTSATRLITDLLRCVLWLLKHGIYVIGFSGERRAGGADRIVVRVAASPHLYILFGRDGCSWRQRRQDGALTIHTWFGERFGCRVEWEEVTLCV